MKHLNERHSWFSLDVISTNDRVIRYTTTDNQKIKIADTDLIDEYVALHVYGLILLKKPLSELKAGWFINNTTLKTIELPYTIELIKSRAFSGCENLTAIHLPEKLEMISLESFFNCPKLKDIYIRSLDNWTFQVCTELMSRNVSDKHLYVNGKVLKELTVPDTIICKFSNNTQMYGVCQSQFSHCIDLKSVVIPEGVKSIGWKAFSGCKNLKELTIPESLNNIKGKAFRFTDIEIINYGGTKKDFIKKFLTQAWFSTTPDDNYMFWNLKDTNQISKDITVNCKNETFVVYKDGMYS